MKKRRNLIIGIIILGVVGFFIYSRTKGSVAVVTPVEVEQVQVQKTVSASGTVTSVNEADLALPATGQLQYLAVEKGEEVTKGQLLANVYNYDTSQTAESLREARDVASRDVQIYIENYETNLDAAGGEDEYRLNLKRLKQLENKAEASYQAALGSLTKTLLYAPFDGTIIDVYSDVGEVVVAGSSIIKIADLTDLVFEISVDQEDFGLLEVGQKVEVTLDSYEYLTFEGTVSELPQYADETTEEFEIKISVAQTEEAPVLLGMNGDATIVVESTDGEVSSLTFDVIYENDEYFYIWTDENGTLTKEKIEIGLEGDVYTELKTNLEGKTVVIPTEENGLEEGTKVKYEE